MTGVLAYCRTQQSLEILGDVVVFVCGIIYPSEICSLASCLDRRLQFADGIVVVVSSCIWLIDSAAAENGHGILWQLVGSEIGLSARISVCAQTYGMIAEE